MRELGELLRSSRPFSWINTFLPFLAGALGAATSHHGGLGAAVALGGVYFLLPYNLLMYGANDLFDYESDRLNPRKGGGVEGEILPPTAAGRLWVAVIVTNVPLLVAICLVGGALGGAAVALTAFIAAAYSTPPLRTKVIPGLDSLTSSLHFTLPCVCGALLAGSTVAQLPWRFLVAFLLWGIASQALGAIQDVEYDRRAGVGSIAVALGARRAAALSTACYTLAVLVTATSGGPGLIAAVALVPYILLAGSCLGGDPRQARQAWRGFLGLNLLAGFVITQVLIHLWMPVSLTATQLIAFGSAGGAIACLGLLVLNEYALRRCAAPLSAAPSLTVVLPARDEASRIGACVTALAAQRYPGRLDILVVDDASTDGTAAEAEAAVAGRGRVVSSTPKPTDWTGKCWACQVGAEIASGDLIAFVDADTILEPDALARLAAEIQHQDGGLLSILTRYEMASTVERALIPGFSIVQTCFMPVALLNLRRGRRPAMAFAYGPCMLAHAGDYRLAGGHAAIRGSDREDLDIGRLFARAGLPVRFLRGADLASTRHFRTCGETVACWRRTFFAYSGNSLAIALAGLLGTSLVTLGPLAMVPVAVLLGDRIALLAALVGSGAILAMRLLLAWRERQPLGSVLWHPVTLLCTAAFQAASVVDGLGGRRPVWRGRELIGEVAH